MEEPKAIRFRKKKKQKKKWHIPYKGLKIVQISQKH